MRKGLTTGEISAHFAEIYGASVSQGDDLQDHRQGDRGDGRLGQPAARRRSMPAIFIDAIVRHEALSYRVEVRDLHRLAVAAVG